MAKLADAPDLGSGAARRVGSTPIIRTKASVSVNHTHACLPSTLPLKLTLSFLPTLPLKLTLFFPPPPSIQPLVESWGLEYEIFFSEKYSLPIAKNKKLFYVFR